MDDDGSILVGAAARDRLISHPERTAAGFKRAMGTSRRYELGGRIFTAEDLSSFVLRRLREDAEAYLGEVVDEAVVSVPAYFAEAQRAATKRAGALAGLTVERLVNEPSAAAVAGHIGEGDEDKVCLVFDFGGGTLDVSLVERFDNVVSVTAVSGDNYLGGRDFDELIARGFCQDCNLNFDSLSRQRQETLIRQAETCKMALTSQEPVIMAVSDDEISASLALTHEWVIRKSSALFQRMLAPVRKVFMDAGVGADELDELERTDACLIPRVEWPMPERFANLADGDELRYGGYRMRAVDTPGHTPGHQCLYLPDQKIMFFGDHVLMNSSPNMAPFPGEADSLGDYLRSLDKVAQLPMEFACMGHGFVDPRRQAEAMPERIAWLQRHHRQRLDEIAAQLEERPGMTGTELAKSITWNIPHAAWEEIPIIQRWIVVCETLAHLDHLMGEGRVRRERAGDAYRYFMEQR